MVVCPVDVIRMKEEGDERTILRWKRTLKMKQCKVCGNYFAPWFQLEKFKEQAKLPKTFLMSAIPAGVDPAQNACFQL